MSATFVSGGRRAIMCPGCAAMHFGPGGFCSDSCREKTALQTRLIITADHQVVHDPGPMTLRGLVLQGILDDLAEQVAGRLVKRILRLVAPRPRSYRYWRKHARRARLGYGIAP